MKNATSPKFVVLHTFIVDYNRGGKPKYSEPHITAICDTLAEARKMVRRIGKVGASILEFHNPTKVAGRVLIAPPVARSIEAGKPKKPAAKKAA